MSHPTERDERIVYQIRVRGVLDAEWSDWFDEMAVSPQANGDTLLTGPVRDQSALHGILAKIRDLGVPLLSLTRIKAASGKGASVRDVNDGLQGGICVS
jgi:hypothetical protein